MNNALRSLSLTLAATLLGACGSAPVDPGLSITPPPGFPAMRVPADNPFVGREGAQHPWFREARFREHRDEPDFAPRVRATVLR